MTDGPGKDPARLSDEELVGKKKTLTALLAVLAVVEALYLAYYAYLVIAGQFDAERHLLGLVPLVPLNLVMVLNIISINKLSQEQQRRLAADTAS